MNIREAYCCISNPNDSITIHNITATQISIRTMKEHAPRQNVNELQKQLFIWRYASIAYELPHRLMFGVSLVWIFSIIN